MKIIADESVDYAIIQALRSKGFEIYSILEQSPGIDDRHVLAIANRHKGILITEDKDFGELTYRLNKRHHGILLIRLSGSPTPFPTQSHRSLVTSHHSHPNNTRNNHNPQPTTHNNHNNHNLLPNCITARLHDFLPLSDFHIFANFDNQPLIPFILV